MTHTPDPRQGQHAGLYVEQMKDWLLTGAIETDEQMAIDLAGPGYHINRSNLLVLESKADICNPSGEALRACRTHPTHCLQPERPVQLRSRGPMILREGNANR